ncbi:hypothetical protein GCM10027074_67050 [Streptomyces deserti]
MVVGGAVPVVDVVVRAVVEEGVPGEVGAAVFAHGCGCGTGEEQGAGECVGGHEVQAAIGGECRGPGHGVEKPLHAGRDIDGLAAGPGGGAGLGGSGQVEQVGALVVVNVQRAGHRIDDFLGDA